MADLDILGLNFVRDGQAVDYEIYCSGVYPANSLFPSLNLLTKVNWSNSNLALV